MANIKEIAGNILDTNCQTIVNTVTCVGIMGKGIALEFRYRYPDMFKAYEILCKEEKIKPGLLFLWEESKPWILNFPTKNHWKDPSKIDYIKSGLEYFADNYVRLSITSIAFPRLGTTSGGLNWKDVKQLMYEHLEPLENIEIEIYKYNPNAKDMLFDKLYDKIKYFEIDEYVRHLDLSQERATLLKKSIDEGKIHTMFQLQQVKGLGNKSISKIYLFMQYNSELSKERQMKLTF